MTMSQEIMTRMPYRYAVGVLAKPVCSEQVSSACQVALYGVQL
jgi:hypothetical protein